MKKKRHNWKTLISGTQVCAECSLMRKKRDSYGDNRWAYWWERGPRLDQLRAADTKTYCPGAEA